MPTLLFTKMHGLGNDFMVIDAVNQFFIPKTNLIRQWGNRHTGIGFDQLLLIEPTTKIDCDFKYRIFNCDGSEVEQCGNGARCFAKYVYEKGLTNKKEIRVETQKAIIALTIQDNCLIRVNMGSPRFDFSSISFIPQTSEDKNSLVQMVSVGTLELSVICVNIGNPHAVIVVDDVGQTPVANWGGSIECSHQFPKKTNVAFVQILARNHVKVRVHERGVGETLACGSGACAAVVAGIMLDMLDNEVKVSLLGGDLKITWIKGGDIIMFGSADFVFDGVIEIV